MPLIESVSLRGDWISLGFDLGVLMNVSTIFVPFLHWLWSFANGICFSLRSSRNGLVTFWLLERPPVSGRVPGRHEVRSFRDLWIDLKAYRPKSHSHIANLSVQHPGFLLRPFFLTWLRRRDKHPSEVYLLSRDFAKRVEQAAFGDKSYFYQRYGGIETPLHVLGMDEDEEVGADAEAQYEDEGKDKDGE